MYYLIGLGMITLYIYHKICSRADQIACKSCGRVYKDEHLCSFKALTYRDLRGNKLEGISNGYKRNRRVSKRRVQGVLLQGPSMYQPAPLNSTKLAKYS